MLYALTHMLEDARHSAASRAGPNQALHQLVLILADGRFTEREALRRAIAVRSSPRHK